MKRWPPAAPVGPYPQLRRIAVRASPMLPQAVGMPELPEAITRLLVVAPAFSTGDAARFGVASQQLTALVRANRLVRLAPGLYGAVRPEKSAPQAHRRRTEALVRRFGGRALASHTSGVIAYDLPVVGADLTTVHLTYRDSAAHRSRRGYRLHPTKRPGLSGAAVPVAEAVVGMGLLCGARPLLVAADAAVSRDLTSAALLAAAVDLHAGAAGIAAVRAALGRLDPRAESPGETLLREDLTALRLRVRSQPTIRCADRSYRADFVIAGTRVLIEFDGVGKYAGPSDIRREKAREEDLRSHGWIVVRFTWSDLDDLAEIRRRVEWALRMDAQLRRAS